MIRDSKEALAETLEQVAEKLEDRALDFDPEHPRRSELLGFTRKLLEMAEAIKKGGAI